MFCLLLFSKASLLSCWVQEETSLWTGNETVQSDIGGATKLVGGELQNCVPSFLPVAAFCSHKTHLTKGRCRQGEQLWVHLLRGNGGSELQGGDVRESFPLFNCDSERQRGPVWEWRRRKFRWKGRGRERCPRRTGWWRETVEATGEFAWGEPWGVSAHFEVDHYCCHWCTCLLQCRLECYQLDSTSYCHLEGCENSHQVTLFSRVSIMIP